jgi:hypothetical protein
MFYPQKKLSTNLIHLENEWNACVFHKMGTTTIEAKGMPEGLDSRRPKKVKLTKCRVDDSFQLNVGSDSLYGSLSLVWYRTDC